MYDREDAFSLSEKGDITCSFDMSSDKVWIIKNPPEIIGNTKDLKNEIFDLYNQNLKILNCHNNLVIRIYYLDI